MTMMRMTKSEDNEEVAAVPMPAPLPGLIRRLSTRLEAHPTGLEPRLPELSGIRAVAFDIYGTLFISGSGDIGTAATGGREEAMRAVLAQAGLADPPREGLVGRFLGHIRSDHARLHAEGVEFPEVEIREIWKSFLAGLGLRPEPAEIERMAVEYECAVNPVWPMPGLAELLTALRARGLPLAIVSNAQFFTPLLFDAFLDAPPEALGFPPDLSVWSYAHRRAKPGAFLYRRLAEALAPRGIAPEQTLYIGNDMRNDIAPAAATGFRTALFAGDKRSLRLREEDGPGATPDAVATDLAQIPGIAG
jgi:putative hydrolase of the HAD superfamily